MVKALSKNLFLFEIQNFKELFYLFFFTSDRYIKEFKTQFPVNFTYSKNTKNLQFNFNVFFFYLDLKHDKVNSF